MKIIIVGATGMVGQGALLACLRDPTVKRVLAIGRTATGRSDPKLRDLVEPDLFRLDGRAEDLTGYDACFFCLGVSSSGMDEARYTRITHDLTLAVAGTLSRLNPRMTFIYVSGAGTDGTQMGRSMWARVKGRTENDLRSLSFKAAYAFRPGVIQPLDGIRSKTRSYRLTYSVVGPLLTPLRKLMPSVVLTTDGIGRAMIAAARHGAPQAVLEAADIHRLIDVRP
ncbi:epimerase [Methylorubrum thiocyanatum]|uniref:epimerase n=1 Tax=Methylorubrum thiocyanatum TaxID=47958 RepID=UPI00383BEE84